MKTKRELESLINSVINEPEFTAALNEQGYELFEFQCDWANYPDFNSLPDHWKKAIDSGVRAVMLRKIQCGGVF